MAEPDVIARPPGRRSTTVRIVRGVGWTLIATGVLILLYLVYLLFFTNFQTEAAQSDLLSQWELDYGPVDQALPGEDPQPAETAPAEPVSPGDAYAALWFERNGQRIVHQDTLFVVQGTAVADLRKGPGHYTDTEGPGEQGNFAIAGHRTTYGAPFWSLDELEPGDEIHVVDRDQHEWVYIVREKKIVQPTDLWVIQDAPLGQDGAWITLTTCHPRWSAAQRLIVFGELQGDAGA